MIHIVNYITGRFGKSNFLPILITVNLVISVSVISYAQTEDENFYHAQNRHEAGDYAGSIKYLNEIIKSNPSNFAAFYNRGQAKFNLGDYLGAIDDYNKAIEIHPQYFDAFAGRGNVKGFMADYLGAVSDFTSAILLYQENLKSKTPIILQDQKIARWYLLRGSYKHLLNDKINGCLDLSKAGELGLTEAYKLINKYCN